MQSHVQNWRCWKSRTRREPWGRAGTADASWGQPQRTFSPAHAPTAPCKARPAANRCAANAPTSRTLASRLAAVRSRLPGPYNSLFAEGQDMHARHCTTCNHDYAMPVLLQGSAPSSASDSLTLSSSPTGGEVSAPQFSEPPVSTTSSAAPWGSGIGTLRPQYGAVPVVPGVSDPASKLPLRTTSVPSAAIRAAAIDAERHTAAASDRVVYGQRTMPDGLPPRWHRRTKSIGTQAAAATPHGHASSSPAHSSAGLAHPLPY